MEEQKKRTRRKREEVKKEAPVSEWKERVVQIRRVTKVVKGGKKLSFSCRSRKLKRHSRCRRR